MRIIALACAALILSGCANGDWQRLTSYNPFDHDNAAADGSASAAAQAQVPPPVYDAPQSVAGLQPVQQAYAPPPATTIDAPRRERAHALSGARMAAMTAHCKGVARQRADDGGYMGYDDDLQKMVFNGTYANCMKWKTAHAY